MSMGGGAMLKTVGRVIGVGGGRGSQSWKSTPLSKHRNSASSSSEHLQVEEGETLFMKANWIDLGDEIVAHNLGRHQSIDCTILGRPTTEEVVGACYDLDSYAEYANASQGTFPESQGSILISQGYETSVQKSNHSAGVAVSPESNIESCNNVVDWIEPEVHPSIHGVVQPQGRNSVLEAFKLLKNDTAVQGMVMSLAQDKAIWDALLKNEKVIEFRKSLQNGEPKLEDMSKGSDDACDSNITTLFTQAVENVKFKVTEYMDKIMEIIHQVLGFADKKIFTEKDGDILDGKIKSSLMLTIAVLLVLLVKRGQKI